MEVSSVFPVSDLLEQCSGEEGVSFGKLPGDTGMQGAIMQGEFPDQPGDFCPADEEGSAFHNRPVFQPCGSTVDFQ